MGRETSWNTPRASPDRPEVNQGNPNQVPARYSIDIRRGRVSTFDEARLHERLAGVDQPRRWENEVGNRGSFAEEGKGRRGEAKGKGFKGFGENGDLGK